jgi:tRNA(Ile)-lysidine synthase
VSTAEPAAPVSAEEAAALFGDLCPAAVLVLAVSGGPDSTALMVLAARWRAALRRGPELIAVTVDHGLRPESAREARAVKRLAGQLGIRHRTLRWTGRKPASGLQQAAREVRYRLLSAVARGSGAGYVLTGHTRDDQAETVLIRMARGSGLSGLAAMARSTSLAAFVTGRARAQPPVLLRPLIDLPKARLIATLAAVGISFVEDPSNRDPRFTRARLRDLMPLLAAEGLGADRLAVLAGRVRRAELTIEIAVDAAARAVAGGPWRSGAPVVIDAGHYADLPAEVALRLLGRAIAALGREGSVELGKLEALHAALDDALTSSGERLDPPARRVAGRFRRTLAGALVTLAGARLTIEPAPPRRIAPAARSRTLTTGPIPRRSGPGRR